MIRTLATSVARARRPGSARRRILVLLDLVQDVEVLLPLLRRLRRDDEVQLDIWVSAWLRRDSPRTEQLLGRARLPFRWVRRSAVIAGPAPDLRGCDVLITASESSQPAHLAGYTLARRAGAQGLLTCTLQHGLENVGLLADPAATFASEVVFTWHPPELTRDLPAEVRAKLQHVGRAWTVPDGSADPTHDVGVFENLHDARYCDDDRAGFLAGLEALAAGGAAVLLRSHPAGKWSDDRFALPQGVERADDLLASDTLARVRRVVTTPSTVALDAALMRRPVALAAPGSALFSPFPILHDPAAWTDFARRGDDQAPERQRFLERVLLPGDAAERIACFLGYGSWAKASGGAGADVLNTL